MKQGSLVDVKAAWAISMHPGKLKWLKKAPS
jgi:hypothetical protein